MYVYFLMTLIIMRVYIYYTLFNFREHFVFLIKTKYLSSFIYNNRFFITLY